MKLPLYQEFARRATDANISQSLVSLMYEVVRDAEQHRWVAPLQKWAANENAMITRALEHPKKMEEACLLLVATDGLTHDEGQIHTGFNDEKRDKIEAWIFAP